MTPSRPRTKLFYGWRVVAACFVIHCLNVGTVFYSFGIFFRPLSEHFGWTRAETSWGFSLAAVLGAFYAAVLGRVVDRRGPKPVQIFGCVALGLGFAAIAAARSLAQYYLAMALLVALGSAALGPVSSNTAVARWFVQKRGAALGVSTAGISMGGVIFVPVTQLLLDHLGWRRAYLALAAIIVVFGIPPVAAWMRRSPESMGLLPDGAPHRATEEEIGLVEREIERSFSPDEAVRSREFWRIALAFGLTVSGLSAVLLHQIPYLLDQGVSPHVASWVLGGTAFVGVIGKLGFGAMIDRFDQRRVILFCFGLQALGVSLLFFVASPVVLAAYVVLYGYAMGGNATLQATVVGESFGRAHYGAIAGRMSPVIVTLQALGAPFLGWIHDRTGSYRIAFVTVLLTTLGAAACIGGLRRPPGGAAGGAP
ncbi:MAG: MFS transporter [Deltaproteobacteria bacterium]|nr:MFS transporter [Deltaproteobacteria bacterium]